MEKVSSHCWKKRVVSTFAIGKEFTACSLFVSLKAGTLLPRTEAGTKFLAWPEWFYFPSLRGAKATKQSRVMSSLHWIASWSLSSGAHSRDPLARNDDKRSILFAPLVPQTDNGLINPATSLTRSACRETRVFS